MAKKVEDIFSDIDNKSKSTNISQNESVENLDRTSPEWHNQVMALFKEDELVDGMPKVAGLRRVSELLYGCPTFSGPTEVFPSTDPNGPGRATVVFCVQFEHATYQDVADSWIGNTDDAFAVYGVAMASTRAEARALRKALGLHGAAFEEITSKDTASIVRETTSKAMSQKSVTGETLEGTASSAQIALINKLCERANVSLEVMLKDIGTSVRFLNKQNASETIDLLNSYINGSIEIPEHIKRGNVK
jgi:hypothetical protein